MTGIARFEDYESTLQEKFGSPNTDIITVSGLTGTGTTTVARVLCEEFNLEHINAGQFFRDKANEFDLSLQEFDERTTELETEHDRDFDLEWDRTALEYAFTKNNFLLEGRLSGVLLADIAPVRILVTCSPSVVAGRVHKRENLPRERARDYVETRNREVLRRYQQKYGVNPRDETYYNVIVDNSERFNAVKETVVDKVRTLRSSQ